ncbi:hypothetical protein GCM10028824_16390 [Hymenobacter segetis]|uniref:LamG domain-containing protein n=1 Tax=Hymenobacter segetis TaxID=2025509 RepID=A0ABU9LQ83_9BACT
MKNSKVLLFFLALLLFGAVSVMSSCSKKDDTSTPTPTVDKAALTALIDSVNLGYTAAVEGTKPGTYTVGSKATLKTSIDLSTGVKNDGGASQTSVTAAVASLRRAVVVFKNSLIQEVSAANLVAQWKFSGNANDATANGNNGTLKMGYINDPAVVAPAAPVKKMGTTLPTMVPDRFGRANQAYDFNDGAYIEVPYKLALNPQAITISAWVKRNGSNSDNYIVSLDRWKAYKFQLQSADKPFLTVTTTTGGIDKDAESGVVGTSWTHVVTTYAAGTMKFYINGVMVKEWTGLSGTMKATPEPTPLAIGQQLPNGFYDKAIAGGQTTTVNGATVPDVDYYKFYGAGFFKGQMDDIRIYNRALTDAEVNSIFTIENTL